MSPPHIHTCPSDGRAAVGTSQASGGGRAISSASGRLVSRPPLANFPEPGKGSRLVGCLVGNAQLQALHPKCHNLDLMRKLKLREGSELPSSLPWVQELQQPSLCTQFFLSLTTIRSVTLSHPPYLYLSSHDTHILADKHKHNHIHCWYTYKLTYTCKFR